MRVSDLLEQVCTLLEVHFFKQKYRDAPVASLALWGAGHREMTEAGGLLDVGSVWEGHGRLHSARQQNVVAPGPVGGPSRTYDDEPPLPAGAAPADNDDDDDEAKIGRRRGATVILKNLKPPRIYTMQQNILRVGQ